MSFTPLGQGGNPLLAETNALRDGLSLVCSRGYRDVICEVYCAKLLVSLKDEENRRFISALRFGFGSRRSGQ